MLRRLPHRARQPRQDPAVRQVELVGRDVGQRPHRVLAQRRQQQAADVPELVGEVPPRGERRLEVIGVEDDVGPHRQPAGDREAQGVGAELPHDLERVDAVAERLRHLDVMRVAHRAVQVDRVERHAPHEVEPRHDHPRHPEEDDLGSGDQDVGGVVAREVGGLLRPAQGRERPEPGAEPGVEHVLVLAQGGAAGGARGGVLPERLLEAALVAVPDRDAVPPPELARDVPVADAREPLLELDAAPLRDEADLALPVRLERGRGQRLHRHEPLVAQPRLDDRAAAVAVPHGVEAALDLLEQAARP